MGVFRRRKNGDGGMTSEKDDAMNSPPPNDELTEQAQEVMKDNLELMKDVVMRIRDEPEFAESIYEECPRLQHLLDQYPDLRPIFEDPKLVRINFEQVYRDAGGVLPEDEEKKKKSWLVWFVNSPIFKVLKVLLFAKKLIGCIAGGGFAFVSGCIVGCCFEDALEELEDGLDGDFDIEMDANKEALNRAADHMEDPEVQEQIQRILEDPDNLEEAIENDKELSALRDANPLCEELMSDPETMRILTDPDNLRALGEAPSLIEADFIDPEGFMPDDIEAGNMDGMDQGYDMFDGGADTDYGEANDNGFEVDMEDDDDGFDDDEDDGFDDDEEEDEEEEDEEEGWWEEAEMEEQETDNNQGGGKGGQKGAKQQKQSKAQGGENQGRFGGIMATIGVAATDLIAQQIVGNVFGDGIIPGSDLLGGGGGGDVDLGGDDLEMGAGAIDDTGLGDVADDAGDVINDDVADAAEEAVDEADDKVDGSDEKDSGNDPDLDKDGNDKKKGAAVGGAAAGGAAGGAGAAMATSRNGKEANDGETSDEEFNDEEKAEKPKGRSRFGVIGHRVKNLATAVKTAAKEHVAVAVLGDDFGEALVERMEGDSDDDSKSKGSEEDDERSTGRRSRGSKKN